MRSIIEGFSYTLGVSATFLIGVIDFALLGFCMLEYIANGKLPQHATDWIIRAGECTIVAIPILLMLYYITIKINPKKP